MLTQAGEGFRRIGGVGLAEKTEDAFCDGNADLDDVFDDKFGVVGVVMKADFDENGGGFGVTKLKVALAVEGGVGFPDAKSGGGSDGRKS